MSIIKIHDRNFKPYIKAELIKQRLAEIGKKVSKEYHGRNPLVVAILNGAFIVAADLFREIACEAEITFARISSYAGTQTTEQINELVGFSERIAGRHVIVVEDIIDTGLSMQHILAKVNALKPQSVKVFTLLFKREALKVDLTPDYVGFEIPVKFVLGYGLDYDGLGRNLPDIYAEEA